MDKFPITKKGYDKLEREIKELKGKRKEISAEIATAREHGDLSENAEYEEARKMQSLNEGKITDLEDKYSRAEIIDITTLSNNTIKFGATVKLIDEDTDEEVTYIITSEYEADATKKRISNISPIARALLGKKVKEEVKVSTPKGSKIYNVIKIEYKEFEL